MSLYELLHSIPPKVLLGCIRQIHLKNDVVFYFESFHLTSVLNILPGEDDGKPIHVIRDRNFNPIVAFDTLLDSEIALSNILARQVMLCESLKHLSPAMIAAHCYCAMPVGIVVNPDCKCKVSQVFDPDSKTIVTKIYDNIVAY